MNTSAQKKETSHTTTYSAMCVMLAHSWSLASTGHYITKTSTIGEDLLQYNGNKSVENLSLKERGVLQPNVELIASGS
jgi:hypothetical protein